jgi:hypothetical protein
MGKVSVQQRLSPAMIMEPPFGISATNITPASDRQPQPQLGPARLPWTATERARGVARQPRVQTQHCSRCQHSLATHLGATPGRALPPSCGEPGARSRRIRLPGHGQADCRLIRKYKRATHSSGSRDMPRDLPGSPGECRPWDADGNQLGNQPGPGCRM